MADDRLVSLLDAAGADALVTADPGLVRMLTGHAGDIGSGPSPFGLAAVAVASREGAAQLVCSADEQPQVSGAHVYEGFTTGPIDPVAGARAQLRAALAVVSVPAGAVVIDEATVPSALLHDLVDAIPADPRLLAALPAVKTAAEVDAVEAALRVCEAGHLAGRAATVEGADELGVWAAIDAAIERAAGGRTTVIADLVSGPRTEDVGGPPGTRRLGEDDVVLCDLVPRVDGIWGDSCAAWSVGRPTAQARHMHDAVTRALRAGLEALRPGVPAAEVDAAARGVVERSGYSYPHHSGHGIGFHWHEEPRIVPGGATVIDAGMVVALEPGAYAGGAGVRVEQVAVVTDDGCRVLSRHSLRLEREDGGPA
jgi:Xaa-Pro aminopeptidase